MQIILLSHFKLGRSLYLKLSGSFCYFLALYSLYVDVSMHVCMHM